MPSIPTQSIGGRKQLPEQTDRYPCLISDCIGEIKEILEVCDKKKSSIVLVDGGNPPLQLINHYRRLVYLNAIQRKSTGVYNFLHDAFCGSHVRDKLGKAIRDVITECRVSIIKECAWKANAIQYVAQSNQVYESIVIFGFDDESILHAMRWLPQDFESTRVCFKNIYDKFKFVSFLYLQASKQISDVSVITWLALLCGSGGFMPPLIHGSSYVSRFEYVLGMHLKSGNDLVKLLHYIMHDEVTHAKSSIDQIKRVEQPCGSVMHEYMSSRQPSISLPTTSDDAQGIQQWRHSYYKSIFFFSDFFDPKKISEMYTNNLNCCFKYLTGKTLLGCDGPGDESPYPYGYAPLASDVYEYISVLQDDATEKRSTHPSLYSQHPQTSILHSLALTYHPDLQYSINDISNPTDAPDIAQHLMQMAREARTLCMDLFPCSYNVNTYLRFNPWDCVPIVPMLDIDRVLQYIDHASIMVLDASSQRIQQ